ncbi:MAG: MMPL family transporter [Planctomycetota bacterium]|nr:MMPL family transporter [Planctomycetota bacterium]
MKRIVHAFVSAVQRNPLKTLAVCLAIGVVAALLIARLRLSSDITNLFPPDAPEVGRFRLVAETFDLADTLLIIISTSPAPSRPEAATANRGPDPSIAELRRFGNLLWAELFPGPTKDTDRAGNNPGPGTGHFRPPMHVELAEQSRKTLASHGLLFLKDEDFDALILRLDAAGIEDAVEKSAARLAISPPMPGGGLRAKDVLGIAELLINATAALAPLAAHGGPGAELAALPGDPLSAVPTATASPAGPDGAATCEAPFTVSNDGSCLLLRLEGTAHARDTEFSKALLARAAEAEAEARREYARLGHDPAPIAVHTMGGYVTAAENEQSMRHDISLTISTGVLAVSLILLLFLRSVRAVFFILSPLAFATLWTFGLAGGVFSPLNTVTLAFAAILAGLGVDLSIHLYLRHASETGRATGSAGGAETIDATSRTYLETGYGVLFATLTTVGAFATLAVSSFPGVRRMSLLVAFGMLLALLANYTVLPALVALIGKSPPGAAPPTESPKRGPVTWLVHGVCNRAFAVLAFAACIVAAGVYGATQLQFESDPQRLVHSSEQTSRARTLMQSAFPAFAEPVMILHWGPTEETVLAESRRFASWLDRSPLADRIRARFSIGELIPAASVQSARLAKLASIDPDAVGRALVDSLDRHGFNAASFDDYVDWVKDLVSVKEPLALRDLGRSLVGRFVRRANRVDPGEDTIPRGEHAGLHGGPGEPGMAVLGLSLVWPAQGAVGIERRRDLLHDLKTELERASLSEVEGSAATRPGSLPESAASPAGTPSVPVGFDVMMDALEKLVYSEMWLITALAAACVFALVLIQFRCLWFTLAALIPVSAGLLAGAGIIWSLGWKLDFLSVAFFPIVVGIGVDDGIHLVHRFRCALKEGGDGVDRRRAIEQVTNDAGLGVMLTSLTTIGGFGSLALAQNPLLVSLGVVVSVGVGTCLVASLTVLPAVLFVCKRNRRLL